LKGACPLWESDCFGLEMILTVEGGGVA
jgi:hypothetical protein